MSNNKPSQEIPAGIRSYGNLTENFPIVGKVEWKDAMIVYSPPMFMLLFGSAIVPGFAEFMIMPLVGVLTIIGSLVLILKPGYITLSEWVRNYRHYKKTPNPINKTLDKHEDVGEEKIEINGIETATDDTRDWIRIKKLYPDSNCIERKDGTLVAMARIQGLNLDKSSPERVEDSTNKFADYLNNSLTEEIQIYLPMRSFDATERISHFEDRKSDPDMKRKDMVRDYLEDRISWYKKVIGDNYVRECYVIVKVSEDEIRNESLTETETRSNIEDIPLIGDTVKLFADNLFGEGKDLFTEEDVKEEQTMLLDDRINQVSRGFVQGINQSKERLSCEEMAGLIKEFWKGTEVKEKEEENLIRGTQFVASESEMDKAKEGDI
jgi:hypothetical protein